MSNQVINAGTEHAQKLYLWRFSLCFLQDAYLFTDQHSDLCADWFEYLLDMTS
jgi:hypothetical protein